MKITEKRLRSIIRSVIKEARATEDESLLQIGGDLTSTDFDPYYRREEKFQDNKKIKQLFKAWCSKNDVAGMKAQEIVDFFFDDYPEFSRQRSLMPDLLSHAKMCGQIRL